MFTAGYFPEGYFPPGYFPKTGGKIVAMLYELLQNTVLDVSNLNLQLNGNAVDCFFRKGVKRQPGVEPSTSIQVVKNPATPFDIEYTGFRKASILYPIRIGIVAANPRDWLTNLQAYIDWFDSIITLFVPPKLTTTNLWGTSVNSTKVFEVRVIPGDFLEPDDMVNMFDVVNIDLEVKATLVS